MHDDAAASDRAKDGSECGARWRRLLHSMLRGLVALIIGLAFTYFLVEV